MPVNFRCRRCGMGLWLHDSPGPRPLVCSRCGESHAVSPQVGTDAAGNLVSCFVCGCDQLYRQRDFNRKVGLVVVAVAAVLAPFTHYLSLVGAALLDLLLYLRLGQIAICYHCAAIHRGIPMGDKIASYDLATHERYENRDWGSEVR